MSRTFDTGLSVAQRTAIRAAVIAKLQPLRKTNGLYLHAVKPLARPYRGTGDADGLVMLNMALQGQFPAALVALGRQRFSRLTTRKRALRAELEVIVYVASANPRSLDDGRLAPDVTALADDTADPGIEIMLMDVAQQLVDQDLGVAGVYEPDLVEDDATFTGADFTVFEQTYSIRCDLFINPARAITKVVTSLEADHNLDGAAAINPIAITVATLEEP